MELLMQAYEDKRSRERDNRSDSMCTSFSFARVQTSIPRAPVEPHVQIKLMFYEPDPLGVDNLTNIAVATITRQKTYDRAGNIQHTHFAHVELALGHDLTGNAFETNPLGQMMAFSINQYSPLYFKFKLFRRQYRSISLGIPVSKYKHLYGLCSTLSAQPIKFDAWGMYAGPVAPDVLVKNRSRKIHGTYCSRIITEVMQESGVGNDAFMRLKPWRVTPNLLSTCFTEASLG